MMKRSPIVGSLVAAILVFAFVVACSMPLPARQDSAKKGVLTGGSLGAVTGSLIGAALPIPEGKEKAQTIEALLDRLADLKKQKAAIEKEEGEVSAMVKEKMRSLQLRLKQLGVDGEGIPLPKQERYDLKDAPKDKKDG